MSAAPARSWELVEGAADGKADARLFLRLQPIRAENCSGDSCPNRQNETLLRGGFWYRSAVKKNRRPFPRSACAGVAREVSSY
jgi:hypothetical protein